jgi:sec-independent protein translocase protein TatA
MGIGMRELIIILLVVLLVFGAKKLRTIGTDLGAAVRGFKKSVSEGENDDVAKLRSDAPDADFADSTKSGESAEKRDRNA